MARSSSEVEYRALTNLTAELQWLVYLFKDMHSSCPLPITVSCDSQAAIHISQNTKLKKSFSETMDPITFFYTISFFLLLSVSSSNIFAESGVVGVNYGRLGNNLPSPAAVISLLKSRKINHIRLFSPDKDVLNSLRGSGVKVVLGVRNQDIRRIGNDPAYARTWIKTNIVAFKNVQFRYISVGNEVDIPRSPASAHILPAMQNLNSALKAIGIKFPESSTCKCISFAYNENRQTIKLDYALFTANRVVVTDGSKNYRNMFDAITDATYLAIEKVGGPNVRIVITESGWSSPGNGNIATIRIARTYINNMISHVSGTSGTPKRPGKSIETYVFALFNENVMTGDRTEKHFGLYYPDMRQVYPVTFR
ncbi:putative glucan endo-1,3-beta-glucosidase GVI [Papaver somniferum]|uniref:putative glucan endo-1,3-beta-glucosidase GVI n=1 Tax=Papaver somniferum TaxID=3469 RepID=UPI000E7022AA|nr:putative glucan endo-1,3-beta-glucosidase GVI [Papaver somniferum]